MQLHDLRPQEGAKRSRKRIGRGNSSGHGTTAGRGTKGQLSRSGGGKGPVFEGGQQPLARRLPKLPGFTNRNRVEYIPINVSRLETVYADGDTVDFESLLARGVIASSAFPVKILGDGEISKKLIVRVGNVSASAQSKIEAAGGKVELSC